MCNFFFVFVICALGFFNIEVTSLEVVEISACDNVEVDEIDGLVHESKINPDGTFTGRLKIPFDLDDSISFKTTVSTWQDGNWNKETVELAGELCGALNKYIPTLWNKVADTVNVPHDCPIPAGDYRLENFSIAADDLPMPAVDLTTNVLIQTEYTKDDKLFLCEKLELSP